jgi:hypothetical protein
MGALTIAFHSNQLSLRGTEVALYDYAQGADAVLGHRCIVLYPAHSQENDPQAIQKFKKRFEVLSYHGKGEFEELLLKCNANLLYAIKAGKPDGVLSQTVPTMVHSVFPTAPSQAHGASFAYISVWLSHHCSRGHIPAVPHIVTLPQENDNLRTELGIPSDATVLGCHGGSKSFDVPAAIEAVHRCLETLPQTWFVFLNIDRFVDHPRAVFLPGTGDLIRKTRFINTCDAMLHARLQGESFGLACGEFSIRNKPVITFARSKHKHHIDVLGDAGWLYRDADELMQIIKSLNSAAILSGNWDRYTGLYNPNHVMGEFDKHLIWPALRNQNRCRPQLQTDWRDSLTYWKFKLAMRLGKYL